MSFMDRIKGQFKEAKEQKAKEKTSYQSAYEEEKRLIQEERATAKEERKKQKIERAREKAKRDVRNPLYRRLAKKAGELTLKAVDSTAIQIGKTVKAKQQEIYLTEKARRGAGFNEITKIVAEQKRAAIRASPPIMIKEKQSLVSLFGNKSMNPLNSGSNMNPLGSSKENLLGDFNPLGTSKSSGKKSKKYSILDGL